MDTEQTAADPDGPGPLTSGYDDDFKEPVSVPVDPESQTGESARVEKPLILVPCQVEDAVWEALQSFPTGISPDFRILLVFHFKDLERLGLVDIASGDALIRVNDRLVSIKDKNENLVQAVPDPPGLFVTEAQPRAYGLGKKRNLFLATFRDRDLSTRARA